jgi:hypothetical protein
MRGVNNRNFFNIWQLLYRDTCPAATQNLWQVGDIEWRRERHSFFGTAYAVSNEVHLLRRRGRSSGWLLMVVIENWWNERHDVLKSTTWARVVDGNPKTVIAWMREHERQAERAALPHA